MANDNNSKDISNSLSKYTDYAHKGTNFILDSAEHINKWYAEQLNNITESDIDKSRIETGIDNSTDTNDIAHKKEKEISTKVKQYNEIQTKKRNNKGNILKSNRIQTTSENDNNAEIKEVNKDGKILEKNDSKVKTSKRISTGIKGAKLVNNSAQKIIRTGKDISAGLNENGTITFKNSSTRIMNKPIKTIAHKANSKIKKETVKYTNIFTEKIRTKTGKKIIEKLSNKKILKITNNNRRPIKLFIKIVNKVANMINYMIPQISPIIVIIVVIVTFCSFFGIGMNKETLKNYEKYMISTQQSYDKTTVKFFKSGKVVDGAIEGKGMINWKAPLSILQMLNGDLTFDIAEITILEQFRNAGLYEQISNVLYTYEKETDEVDENGNKIKETVKETKIVVKNPSLDDYISWCSNNFNIINQYKASKGLNVDWNQKSFTNDEVDQIKLLYNSNSFFELFGSEFKSTYAYLNVNIGDEQLKAIYNEFLNNIGKRYLMDHSNLNFEECMEYYDCSSWVIHCLAHTGIKKIPNTSAQGIYSGYCYPVNVNDRKAGDLIFLKDTYNTGKPGSISHVGIYMGTLTIDGVTDEWVIDTGSNPSGVRIRKYNNGWWNGPNFFGFGRLKQ